MAYHFPVPEEIAVRVDAEAMRATAEGIFRKLGLPDEDARRSADVLIYADLRGIDSHGVSNMMRLYVEWIRGGSINPTPQVNVLRETAAIATVDSDRGLGLAVGPRAMEMAIDKARTCGVGAVTVANGRHFGAAAYHAALAMPHDMIGVAMTIGGVYMAPTFAAKAMLGVNPIALAAPARNEPPFVFDASTSSVAVNKIFNARRLGQKIPPGWIADEEGTPVMHEAPVPEKFIMLPVGGTREIGSHKAYGLAVMIEILSGLLGGSPPAFARDYLDVSHHFVAYDIRAWTDVDTFKDTMDSYLKGLRETPPAPGHDRVLYAGLPEHETEADRRARGIPYHPAVIEWHRKMTAEMGLEDRLDEVGG